MDFNTVMQTVLTLMVGALCWFIQRSVKKLDEGIAKLDERINTVEKNSSQQIDRLKDEFHEFQRDMPLVYTLREDTLRGMSSIEDKINKLLYRKGGTGNE